MGKSEPPKSEPMPNRVRLRGDVVLDEIVKLRSERADAREFFSDVTEHFPNRSFTTEIVSISLPEGINIVALPVDPSAPVTSYGFLTDVTEAVEVVDWDGILQQYGATAFRSGEDILGDDFTFELGYGYFVTMSSSEQISFNGDPLTEVTYISIPTGLEAISLVGSLETVTSYTVFDGLLGGTEICRMNPELQSYECAFRVGLEVFGEEFNLKEGEGYFIRTVYEGYFPTDDDTDPFIAIISPQDNDTILTKYAYIDIIFNDNQSGLNSDRLPSGESDNLTL